MCPESRTDKHDLFHANMESILHIIDYKMRNMTVIPLIFTKNHKFVVV